jgi:hypothetical protein
MHASFLHAVWKRAEQEWCHVIITEIINSFHQQHQQHQQQEEHHHSPN